MKSLFLILLRVAAFCGVSQLIVSGMLQTASKAYRTLTAKLRTLEEEARTLHVRFHTLFNEAQAFPEKMPRLYARLEAVGRHLRTHHQEIGKVRNRVRFIIRFSEIALPAHQWKALDWRGLEGKLAENEETHRGFYNAVCLFKGMLAEKRLAFNPLPATLAGDPSRRAKTTFNWARLWDLLSFLLPKKTRERVFEPCRNELLEDLQRAKKYKGKWETRWLCFCFTFRTIWVVVDCWRAMLADKALSLVLKAVPEIVKRWWVG